MKRPGYRKRVKMSSKPKLNHASVEERRVLQPEIIIFTVSYFFIPKSDRFIFIVIKIWKKELLNFSNEKKEI